MAGRSARTAYAGSAVEAAREFPLLARQRAVCGYPHAGLREGLRIRRGSIDGRPQVGVAVPYLQKVGVQAVSASGSRTKLIDYIDHLAETAGDPKIWLKITTAF